VSALSPDQLPAWRALQAHHARLAPLHLRDLFADDARRFQRFSLQACDLFLDYSKNRLTGETLGLLAELARQCEVEAWRERMIAGDRVNASEQRAALHMALRVPAGEVFPSPAGDVVPAVQAARRRMREMSESLRHGRWKGHTGKAISEVVHVGIGGSRLGPEMAVAALANSANSANPAPAGPRVPRLRFVSSVSADDLSEALGGLDPETTLFIVVSKSFTTSETMMNASSARAWLLEQGTLSAEAIARHFVAITANAAGAADFGIPESNQLPMWDWVGGRFSVCSSVSLAVAISAGMDGFDELLAGAHDMDRHFLDAPLLENMPIILGLIGVWYRNFFAAPSRAVLPYDYALRGLPAYLQQLEMESAGKQTGRDGEPLDFATCPVVWGASGDDAQHSFFQLLHQGSELVPCDFLVPVRSHAGLAGHDDELLANALAQSEALMRGRDAAETRAYLEARDIGGEALRALLPQCIFKGNQPSNTLLYERLTARRLGALIALYEHRLFVQSVCWGVNAFDQWGVEFGKELARDLRAELGGGARGGHDASTAGLLARALGLKTDC
jgi:glucose-6-phosphate isomerase